MMEQREKVEADDIYIPERGHCVCPGSLDSRADQSRLRGKVRMRHEHINERIKNFGCMVQRFRHSTNKHSACFRAVCVITQLAMESGETMINMAEYDDRLSDAQIAAIFG